MSIPVVAIMITDTDIQRGSYEMRGEELELIEVTLKGLVREDVLDEIIMSAGKPKVLIKLEGLVGFEVVQKGKGSSGDASAGVERVERGEAVKGVANDAEPPVFENPLDVITHGIVAPMSMESVMDALRERGGREVVAGADEELGRGELEESSGGAGVGEAGGAEGAVERGRAGARVADVDEATGVGDEHERGEG